MIPKEIRAKVKSERSTAILETKVRLEDLFICKGNTTTNHGGIGGDCISVTNPIKVDPKEILRLEKELDDRWRVHNNKVTNSTRAFVKHHHMEMALLRYKTDCVEAICNTYKIVGSENIMRLVELFDFSTSLDDAKLTYVSMVRTMDSFKK